MGKTRAKSVPAHLWDQHKEFLYDLYITEGYTVGRVQDKMARKGFYARYAYAKILSLEELMAEIC